MGKPQKKTRNPGVGVDFKRVKHKVGKKLPKARNETDTDFKSKSINLPSQTVREDRSGIAVNYQNLTLKELLNQTSHHNDKSRKHSLVGLADLFQRHPEQLQQHVSQVLGTLAERVVDGDSGVRAALRELLATRVLPDLGQQAVAPFMPMLMAHVCGAMTHLSLDVRNDALLFLDVLMDHVPQLVVKGFLAPCLAHFCDLFSGAHRSRSIRAQSLATLNKLLTALTSFLARAFPAAEQHTARTKGTVHVPDGQEERGEQPSKAAVAAAGPGPSSTRQQAAAASRNQAPVVDPTQWSGPAPRVLMATLVEMFQSAAITHRTAGGERRGNGTSDGSGKAKGKRGHGAVSTTEVATSSHLGKRGAAEAAAAAAAGPSGGKGVAAAAAALAAVTGGPSAPSSSTAAAPTTMAAALAAASDARASSLRLVTLLMDAWLECAPASLSTAPELDQAAALAMIVIDANTLLKRMLLPEEGSSAPPATPLLSVLADVVVKRVSTTFPATMPPVRPPTAVYDAMVRLNLQSAKLLGRFLPLVHQQSQQTQQQHEQQQQRQKAGGGSGAAKGGTAAAPASLQPAWVPGLVSYYVGVLERSQVLPVAAGTLSDSAPASAQGLSANAADAVLTAVAAAVPYLEGDAAQRLMAAVTDFATRQPARSAARLACIRMQHALLKTALAGRLFLEHDLVSSWLTALPKLLWEVGGSAPDTSAAALTLLLDAARFTTTDSPMTAFLNSTIQPQLAPLFATQLPPKAAKAALAKRATAAGSGTGSGSAAEAVGKGQARTLGGGGAAAGAPGASPAGAASSSSQDVMVLLPGAISNLPEAVARLAVDVLYHMGPLTAPLLKALAAALSSAALPLPIALRTLHVVLCRMQDAPDPALAASWLLTLLFGPQHAQLVLAPDGTDLTADWARQRALVEGVAVGVGRLGGAGQLLRVLAPQLVALPLGEVGTAGAPAARMRRYSLVRLCVLAAGERGGLPAELRGVLPSAMALSGLECGVAAAAEQGEAKTAPAAMGGGGGVSCGMYGIVVSDGPYGPVVQLCCEEPSLLAPVVRFLVEALRAAAGEAGASARGGRGGAASGSVGGLSSHAAALSALQLVGVAVKAGPLRSALAGVVEGGAAAPEREGVLAAVGELVAVSRGLPVPAGVPVAAELVAACGVEGQRLTQTVADLFGRAAAGGQGV